MGIQGLLPFLKGIQREVHVSSFRGRKVAVDAYCWLHKGAYSCALQLVMKTDKLETLPFIKYCMKRVNMLLQNGLTPILVFDGSYLPLKAGTEKDRRERRQVNLEKGKALLKEGKRSEAVDCFQKSVDVSPEMALALIKECRSAGVEYIVAPYEADSQLAYLSKEGIVDLIVTEDSDLLVFGCKKVMFKLDDSGNGKLVEIDQLGKANRGLVGFTIDSFRHMCILSGCDYLASVPGIGLGKSLKLMKRFNRDPYRVIKALRYETGKVPQGYEIDFRKADQTFLYQMVFDPRTQKQVRLNQLPDDLDAADFEFAGVPSSPRKAVGMARGNINPLNQAVMDSYSPSKAPPPKSKCWSGSVMGGDGGWGHSSRPPSSLLSSESSRNHFKPPKKLKPKSVILDEVDGLKDEDLQAMYLNASMTDGSSCTHTTSAESNNHSDPAEGPGKTDNVAEENPPKQPIVKSKFFSSSKEAEETPSDLDVAEKLRARRRLSLLPPTVDRPASSLSPSQGTVQESPIKPSHDEKVTREPPGHGRKRLHFPAEEKGVRASLQGFGYSKAKRPKHGNDSCPFSLLDETSPPKSVETSATTVSGTSQTQAKNPFAKALINQAPCGHIDSVVEDGCSDKDLECTPSSAICGTDIPQCDVLEDTDVRTLPDPSLTATCTQAVSGPRHCHPFMTSVDYITTHPALQEQASSSTTILSSTDTSSQHPLFSGQKRVSLGNSGKRRCGAKGASKSNVNSKFKAPKRSLDSLEPGLRQLDLLAQFAYSSRPRMSREQ